MPSSSQGQHRCCPCRTTWANVSDRCGASEGAKAKEGHHRSRSQASPNNCHKRLAHSQPLHPTTALPRRGQPRRVAAAKSRKDWVFTQESGDEEGKESSATPPRRGSTSTDIVVVVAVHQAGISRGTQTNHQRHATPDPATRTAKTRIRMAK